jgi:hypothetical protein
MPLTDMSMPAGARIRRLLSMRGDAAPTPSAAQPEPGVSLGSMSMPEDMSGNFADEIVPPGALDMPVKAYRSPFDGSPGYQMPQAEPAKPAPYVGRTFGRG